MSIQFHVTPSRNIPSIRDLGIDPYFSLGKRPECWFCSRSLIAWAVEHVAERHGVPVSAVSVLRVNVPRSQLVSRGRGKWTCAKEVRSIISVLLPAAA